MAAGKNRSGHTVQGGIPKRRYGGKHIWGDVIANIRNKGEVFLFFVKPASILGCLRGQRCVHHTAGEREDVGLVSFFMLRYCKTDTSLKKVCFCDHM